MNSLHKTRVLGIRAGTQPHRFVGVWFVVVRERVFIRPWNNKSKGWYQVFMKEPVGTIQIEDKELPVRVRRTRGERLLDAIDSAYREKFPTLGSRNYVKGFTRKTRRAATLELLPR